MGRKTPLTSQTKKINLVIRKNIEIPSSKVKEYCEEYFERYAFIEHKGDIEPTTKEIEGVHYHICGDMKKEKTPLSTRLNEVVKYFGFDNANGIQIEQYSSLEGSIQYLTHKNYKEKTQHNLDEVITNIPREEFMLYYLAETKEIVTADMIIMYCYECKSYREILRKLGLSQFRLNISTIKVIFEEIKEERQRLCDFERYHNEETNI